MGQHAQAIREKHTARNVTLIVLAVLVCATRHCRSVRYATV